MNSTLPRDEDGYVDLDMLPDDDTDFDVAGFAQTPPLDAEVWNAMVTRAPYAEPSAGIIDFVVDDSGAVDEDPAPDATWAPPSDESAPGDAGSDNLDNHVPDEGHGSNADW